MELVNKRVIIFAVHPDDELLSSFYVLSEALKSGSTIKVIFITSGESNYLCNIKVYKKPLSIKNYIEIREKEAKTVMKELGIQNFVFWRFPDGKLSKKKNDLLEYVLQEIKSFQPDVLIAPSMFDVHKDHNTVGLTVYTALNLLDKQDIKTYYYIIHKNSYMDSIDYDVKINLSDNLKQKKEVLLEKYKSQFLCNKRFFLNFLNREEYLSKCKLHINLPLQVDFIGKNLIWIKIKKNSSFLNPLKLNISSITEKGFVDFTLKINWNKEKVPIYFEKDKKIYDYVKLQKLSKGTGYVIFPTSIIRGEEIFIKLSNFNPVYDITGYLPIKRKAKDISPPKTCVVIPCFNIANFCAKSAKSALEYADNVVVVNDGSTDNTKDILEKLSYRFSNLHVVNIKRNSGKGKALLKGINYAMERIDFDLLITMDGDLQHRAEDIPLFKQAWMNGGEIILGVRKWNKKVPLRSKIGNSFINVLCSFFLKKKVKDSQTGFRGFSKEQLKKIIASGCIKEGRYETELDMFLYSYLTDSRIIEIEIPAIYLNGNATSHFKPILDSLRIIKEFFSFYFRCVLKKRVTSWGITSKTPESPGGRNESTKDSTRPY
jgi:LmbE family N-acetylglucosaminyl deacetylase